MTKFRTQHLDDGRKCIVDTSGKPVLEYSTFESSRRLGNRREWSLWDIDEKGESVIPQLMHTHGGCTRAVLYYLNNGFWKESWHSVDFGEKAMNKLNKLREKN